MEVIRQALLGVHLVSGVAALVLFWVPALTKKGGPAHRRAGRWYVTAMTLIAVTGFALALLLLASAQWQAGVFLLFLGVITATSLWNGWRALRIKKTPAAYTDALHFVVALVNVLGGLALVVFGLAVEKPLFYAFGPVGLIIGGTMLRSAVRNAGDPKWWLYEHFTGMIGSGIASHVAFLAFGARQLFGWGTGGYTVFLWIAPVVIGTGAIVALNVHYRATAINSRTASPLPTPNP